MVGGQCGLMGKGWVLCKGEGRVCYVRGSLPFGGQRKESCWLEAELRLKVGEESRVGFGSREGVEGGEETRAKQEIASERGIGERVNRGLFTRFQKRVGGEGVGEAT